MYQHPGVYVEHLPSGLLAIEAASTSVAAFVGPVRRGTLNAPVFVTSASLFAQQFGVLDDSKAGIRDLGDSPDAFGFAVNAFFNNGGSKAYIVPVGAAAGGAPAKGAIVDPSNPLAAFYFTAASDGAWANGLEIQLDQIDDADPSLGYVLNLGVTADGRFKVLEQYSDVRVDPADGRYLATRVDGQSQLVDVERRLIADVGAGATIALLSAPLGGLDPTTIAAGQTLVLVVGSGAPVTVTFAGTAATLEALAGDIQTQVRAGAAAGTPRAGFLAQVTRDRRLLLIAGAPYAGSSAVTATDGAARTALGLDPTLLLGATLGAATLDATVMNGKTLRVNAGATVRTITFGAGISSLALAAAAINTAMQNAAVAPDTGAALATFAATVVGNQIRMSVSDGGPSRAVAVTPAAGDASALLGLDNASTLGRSTPLPYPGAFDNATHSGATVLMGGTDHNAPANTDYAAAFEVLRDFRDVSIIVLPGKTWIKGGDNGAIEAAIAHAEYMGNRMVIVDPPNPRVSDELVSPKAFLDLGAPNSPYSALYYPWLTVPNPFYDADLAANKPKTFALPPSAFAAGMWARIDASRGVWKAPAGLEATLRGAQGANVVIGNEYQDNLNEWGVNCIRSIQGPAVLWGARTLAAKAKPEFRYIPVRRTQSMIGESLYRALQAVVFEPNDHKLWASLRASSTDFMDGLFRSGAFQGEKASEAYFVHCGLGATMTQGDIDAGIVRLVVGFAPQKPAEFVVIQIQQIVGRPA